jgi:NADPH-dependent FMN reductase
VVGERRNPEGTPALDAVGECTPAIESEPDVIVAEFVGEGPNAAAGWMNRVGSSADGIALNMFENLTDLPRYSETFENRGTPSSVEALRTAAADADAVLIVTTYHGRVPTGVHNAIDWLTRRWKGATRPHFHACEASPEGKQGAHMNSVVPIRPKTCTGWGRGPTGISNPRDPTNRRQECCCGYSCPLGIQHATLVAH